MAKSMVGGSFLRSAACAHPEKVAVITPQGRLTYRQLNDRVNSLSHGLLELGVKKGDIVSILLHSSQEALESIYALHKIGAVPAPMGYRLSAREIGELINHVESETLIYGQEFAAMIDSVRNTLPKMKRYICVGVSPGAAEYEKLATLYSSVEPNVEVGLDHPAFMGFSAGTTGLPKAFLHTCSDLSWVSGIEVCSYFDVTSSDVVFSWTPLYTLSGASLAMGAAVMGASAVVMDFEPKAVLEIIEAERVTFLSGVPTQAKMLMQQPDFGRYDLSSVRGAVFFGEPFPVDLVKDVEARLTPNIYECWGSQEIGWVVIIKPDMKKKKPGSAGFVTPGVNIRLVDEDGNDVSRGEVGELIVKSVAGIEGYYKLPEITSQTFKGGWFYTGDLARQEEDGYIYISGRAKDMIITGGQNVMAAEVEEAVFAHPKVADVAVIGLPDEKWGEAITAVVVLKDGETCSEEEIISFCKDRMAHFKAPKYVKFENVLPRSPAGKVKKFELKEKYKY